MCVYICTYYGAASYKTCSQNDFVCFFRTHFILGSTDWQPARLAVIDEALNVFFFDQSLPRCLFLVGSFCCLIAHMRYATHD